MKDDTRETNILFDYGAKLVRIYTTQKSVYKHFVRRFSTLEGITLEERKDSFFISAPISVIRKPYTLVRSTRKPKDSEDLLDDLDPLTTQTLDYLANTDIDEEDH